MGASHDSYDASDSLPSPWPNLRGLLFFSNTNKLLCDIKANKRTVVPRSSPEVLLKNLGTKGSVPMTGTSLLGLSRDGGVDSWVHTCQPTETWTQGMRSIFSSILDQNGPGWRTHQKSRTFLIFRLIYEGRKSCTNEQVYGPSSTENHKHNWDSVLVGKLSSNSQAARPPEIEWKPQI